MDLYILPSANEVWGKVIFFTCFVYPPVQGFSPEQRPPLGQRPFPWTEIPPGQRPPHMDRGPHPWTETPTPGQRPAGQRSPRQGPHPYGGRAGGTHPTVMSSCWRRVVEEMSIYLLLIFVFKLYRFCFVNYFIILFVNILFQLLSKYYYLFYYSFCPIYILFLPTFFVIG